MKIVALCTSANGALPKSEVITPYTANKWTHIEKLSYIQFDSKSNELGYLREFVVNSENEDDMVNFINNLIFDMSKAEIIIGHSVVFHLSMIKAEVVRNKQSYAQYTTRHIDDLCSYCTMRSSLYQEGGKSQKYPTLLQLHERFFPDVDEISVDSSDQKVLVVLRCFLIKKYSIDINQINPMFNAYFQTKVLDT